MSWRPNNWRTEKVQNHPLHCLAPQECADHFFEAGAEAMLEALRESGLTDTFYTNEKGEVCNSSNMPMFIPAEKPIRGTVVFIPEEEKVVKVSGNSQG